MEVSEELLQQLASVPLRLEAIVHPATMCVDIEHLPDLVTEDLIDGLYNMVLFRRPEADRYLRLRELMAEDGDGSTEEVAEELKRIGGFWIQAATPTRFSDFCRPKWGSYYTCWLHGSDFESAIQAALAWAMQKSTGVKE